MSSNNVVLERPDVGCCQGLNKVVAMSREMLKCAQMDDWQQLILLESERGHLLAEFFHESVNDDESDEVSSSIKLIQALDKKTMQYVKGEYKNVSDELKKLNKGRRVSNAYLQ